MRNRRFPFRLTVLMGVLALVLVGCVGQLGTAWAGLTVINGGTEIVYAYENTLSVVDVATGEPLTLRTAAGEPRLGDNGEPLLWEVNGNDIDNAKFFANPLTYNENSLLVTTLDRRFIEFNLNNSEVVAATEQLDVRGNAVTGLAGTDEQVFVGLQEGLVALDRATLETQWQFETDHGVWSEPYLIGDIAYFTSLDHSMYAVDTTSGETVWSLDLGGAATATPSYSEEMEAFFVGTFESKMLKVSLGGEIVGDYDTDGWVWGSPTLVDDLLYFSDLNGFVYRLDAETLTETRGWRVQVAEGAIRTPPVVFDTYVVVGSRDQHVYWLERDSGNEIFNRMLDGEILSDILYFSASENSELEEDMVVVSTLSNRESLVAFGAATGERIWTYRR